MKKKAEDKNENLPDLEAEEAVQAQPGTQTGEAEPEQPQAEPEINPLEKELETVNAALADAKDKYLRMAAEYDNFRKRSAREREAVYSDAVAQAVLTLLPVLDNLERAAAQETADEAYAKGVEMTLTQFYGCLQKLGVKEIEALGEQFDPNLHNAAMHVEQEGCDDNTIVEVFEKGFTMGDKVIRHAIVKVAN